LQLVNDDGNLIDAFFLAAVLALKNTRLPEVSMKNDAVLINRDPENHNYLCVHHLPVSTTFFFIPGVEDPIVDANAKEERLATARLSICMNIYKDVCGMQTLGQMEVDAMQLIQCSKDALEIAKKTTELVRQAWELKDKLPMLEMQITKAPQGPNTVN
jgi:exosome complex component RRP45